MIVRPRPLPLLAALLLAGCAATQPVPEYRAMAIMDLEAPATAKKGQVVTLKLTARRLDACFEVVTAGATVDEATKTVALIVTERRTQPGPCTQALSFPAAVATFTPASAGTYTVKATALVGRDSNETKAVEKPITVAE